jgi:hypothetical protein
MPKYHATIDRKIHDRVLGEVTRRSGLGKPVVAHSEESARYLIARKLSDRDYDEWHAQGQPVVEIAIPLNFDFT